MATYTANLGTIRVPFYTNSKDLGITPYFAQESLVNDELDAYTYTNYLTLSDLPEDDYRVTDMTAQTPTTIVFKETLPDDTYRLTYRNSNGEYNYVNFTVTGGEFSDDL